MSGAADDVVLAAPIVRVSREDRVSVTLTIPADQVDKLHAFMAADTWDKAMAARDANLAECEKSLLECVRFVRQHHANSTRFIASVLCSLYNGERVKVYMSDITRLDMVWAEHVLNVIRLHYEGFREPHTYIVNGGKIFEEIILQYGLEKRRRKS